MEEIQNESNTNLTSNKDMNESSSTTVNDNNININENTINEKETLLAKKISEYKPEEITLNKKIIIDSIALYNTISTNYGDKKLDITRLAQDQQDKVLLETELFLLNGKNLYHIDALDKYINLKELYLNQNFITEIKGLDNLLNLQVLNLSFNNISKIENIKHLKNLEILDISNNLIREFNTELLPKEQLVYLYTYYNPFFKNKKILDYRSDVIINFEKIERIDKLDITDRERLLLIDKSNLKYNNRLKSLDYIQNHYNDYNKKNQDIFNVFKKKVENDTNKILQKTDKDEKQKSEIFKMTSSEPHVDEEDKNILREIKELKQQSEQIFNDSILSFQNRKKNMFSSNSSNNKKFMESDSVKKLQEQIDLLNDKFKKAHFIDPEVKKKFEEKINNAMRFKERIIHAEELANKVIENFNKKEINKKFLDLKKKKVLESIPEEENKNIEIEENENIKNSNNSYIDKINNIKLEESDSDKEEENAKK
jgi:hypothetical protein